jgi:hypothetical protein
MMVIAVARLVGATARGDDLCQSEKADLDQALARAAAARKALDSYDGSSLAPLVPGQAENERRELEGKVESAWQDLPRASSAHSDCV